MLIFIVFFITIFLFLYPVFIISGKCSKLEEQQNSELEIKTKETNQ